MLCADDPWIRGVSACPAATGPIFEAENYLDFYCITVSAQSSSSFMQSQLDGSKFNHPKTWVFPKQKFGSKDKTQTCKVAWFTKYYWLHYD